MTIITPMTIVINCHWCVTWVYTMSLSTGVTKTPLSCTGSIAARWCFQIVIWDGALWVWSVIKTVFVYVTAWVLYFDVTGWLAVVSLSLLQALPEQTCAVLLDLVAFFLWNICPQLIVPLCARCCQRELTQPEDSDELLTFAERQLKGFQQSVCTLHCHFYFVCSVHTIHCISFFGDWHLCPYYFGKVTKLWVQMHGVFVFICAR